MGLVYSWKDYFGSGVYSPVCDVSGESGLEITGLSLLSYILTDDGGVGVSASLVWIEEGLKIIEKVEKGLAESMDWDRECWGSKINSSGVKIYSLVDDDYFAYVTFVFFKKALSEWLEFVRGYKVEEVIEIDLE
jgi:hypothetical protein